MDQEPSDTILVAIWITLRIRESKVRNPDPPDRRRFVLSECISCSFCPRHIFDSVRLFLAIYNILRHVRIAESEPYCHSSLFVCLSVIPRPTAYHD